LAEARNLRALYLNERFAELDDQEVEALGQAAELLNRLACDPR
jgi:hypothetical protein